MAESVILQVNDTAKRWITMSESTDMLGKAVRTARKNKHLSQEALAERIGVCKRTIIDIENNTGNPKFEILYALVRELDLPLNQVFYSDVSENPEIKSALMQELDNCSEREMKIILAMVQTLRSSLRTSDA